MEKNSNALGIASLILGIIAFVFGVVFFISIPLAIVSIIFGIISLVKRNSKGLSIAGIILSSISIIASIGIILILGAIGSSIGDDDVKSGIVSFMNKLSEGQTENLDIENKLDGNRWKMDDGSVLELRDDGTYYWYKTEEDTTDNYFFGTYKTYLGDRAIEKIDEEYGFNEEGYSHNTAILRTDIYYLELNKEKMKIEGETTDVVQSTKYALFFYYGASSECSGMNLGTYSRVSLEKIY